MKKIVLLEKEDKRNCYYRTIADADVVGIIGDSLDDGLVTVVKNRNGRSGAKMPLEIFGIRAVNGTL